MSIEMAASSNASAEIEWKYKVASAVDVSNVILVKLSGHSNYPIWKAQMLSLIDSQELLHIIYPEYHFPENKGVHMISMYDKLVKGWILGTVGERLLLLLAYLDTAGEVWMKLESIFNPPNIYTLEEEGEEEEDDDYDAEVGDVTTKKQDDKYLEALSIQVSDYVTVKLSKPDNYDIWKSQMFCLLKGKKLLHIIDDEYPFPEDKGVHMKSKYDKLVKNWIFATVDKQMLEDFKGYHSVHSIWRELEYSLSRPVSFNNKEIERKYNVASAVNVANFVSVKLEREIEYKIWKAQMLCLIESQELLHIINAEYPSSVAESVLESVHMINSKVDKLVKGWILSTLGDYWLREVQELATAGEVWMKLESLFNPPKSHTDEGDPAQKQDEEYRRALRANVSDYVSVKLCDRSNYDIWKSQILRLIECEKLLHIIIAGHPFPENKGVHTIPKYDKLVKGWIFTTMYKEVLEEFIEYSSVQLIWKELESRFNRPISYREEGGSWINGLDVSALREDLKYIQVSNVNVSNFVSVKLSGYPDYSIWKAQMMCLLKSQELVHIIEVKEHYTRNGGPMTEKYDNHVKGWILGSINDQLLQTFTKYEYESVQRFWNELESRFNSIEIDTDTKENEGFKIRAESEKGVPEMENTDNIRLKNELYEAAVEGCWWKAKSIFKIDNTAATEGITENGNTILHLAVQMGHNYFVEKLLDFLIDGEDIEKKNNKGRTALHIAAMVGNEYAARLLVQKRKQLLLILDKDGHSPRDCAIQNTNINVSAYLLKSLPSSDLSYVNGYNEGSTIMQAIYTKQYDLAQKMLKEFPEAATKYGNLLKLITISFPNDLGSTESVIYPSFHNVLQKTVVKGSLLFHPSKLERCAEDILRAAKICNNTCCSWLGKSSIILLVLIAILYPIYQLTFLLILVLRLPFSMLYCFLWKVLAITVGPIKNIEKKKNEYKEARKTLSLICDQMGTSNDGYRESIIEAIRQGTYEVVDEILFRSPSTIKCKDQGYNVIQLVIINRSEKIYNLIRHIIELDRDMEDSSENNLVHLVGRLAPSFVLDRNTGAALQLQQELIWREEVQKLVLPLVLLEENEHKETPAMVFTREHQDLLKQGEAWMKTTAESCSITAALIVTIVFAAAITVPGGSNQDSGIPVFKKETAFTVFAAFNALSLFTSTTALLLLLSILTTRFSERDFRVSLPRRLIFGLLMLFLSTTAMIVAFCAILFLVFCDQRPWMLAPICVLACLPISVIVTIKLPLLVDLIRSTYVPIFGKKSYLEFCKINRGNTIFME